MDRYLLDIGGIDAEGYYVYDSVAPERGWYWSWKLPEHPRGTLPK